MNTLFDDPDSDTGICLSIVPDALPSPVGGPPGTLLHVHTAGTCISRPTPTSHTRWNQVTGNR
jgi:hypothetical protein